MKNIIRIFNYSPFFVVILLLITSCNKPVTDFGYDGSLSGKITDASGTFVSGDPNVANLEVKAQGEKDLIANIIRVKVDGTYANNKLYPQMYKVWLTGPIVPVDTIEVDLRGGKAVTNDFVVTPFLTVSPPALEGTPSATQIAVNYNITGNGGRTPNLREVICSTVSWPNTSTGSGFYWTTKKVTVSTNSGTATITGLIAGTKYYVRVSARASGQILFNYSDQIVVTTP